MGVDLSGGLSVDREFVFAQQPDDPEMRESVNVWVWDEGDDVGLPRIGIEAVADQWETHDIQANLAFADGRVLNIFEPGKVHDPLGADGQARVLGAGRALVRARRAVRGIGACTSTGWPSTTTSTRRWPESIRKGPRRCRWKSSSTSARSCHRGRTARSLAEAARVLREQEEGDLMGGPRYEQLFRMTGRLRVGDAVRDVRGGGLRIRRQGVRRLATFWGHAWQSSVFPSGRGVRIHRLSATRRRDADVQRGLPVRRRWRARPGPGGGCAVAPSDGAAR